MINLVTISALNSQPQRVQNVRAFRVVKPSVNAFWQIDGGQKIPLGSDAIEIQPLHGVGSAAQEGNVQTKILAEIHNTLLGEKSDGPSVVSAGNPKLYPDLVFTAGYTDLAILVDVGDGNVYVPGALGAPDTLMSAPQGMSIIQGSNDGTNPTGLLTTALASDLFGAFIPTVGGAGVVSHTVAIDVHVYRYLVLAWNCSITGGAAPTAQLALTPNLGYLSTSLGIDPLTPAAVSSGSGRVAVSAAYSSPGSAFLGLESTSYFLVSIVTGAPTSTSYGYLLMGMI
jgi:hypothetical protein